VPAQPFVVPVADARERDEEVLPGPEVHLFAEEVERHEKRSLSDFLFVLDPSSHA
jgi:hypothetical protein